MRVLALLMTPVLALGLAVELHAAMQLLPKRCRCPCRARPRASATRRRASAATQLPPRERCRFTYGLCDVGIVLAIVIALRSCCCRSVARRSMTRSCAREAALRRICARTCGDGEARKACAAHARTCPQLSA